MKLIVCALFAMLAAAAAQTFDPTAPVMILVNTQQSGTDGAGNAITLNTNDAYGYDNATAGQDGANVYDASTSTDPQYTVFTDPCAENYTDTLCSQYATCVSNTTAYPYVYQCQCNSGFNDTTLADAASPATSPSTLTQSGLVCTDQQQCNDPVTTCGAGVDQCIDGVGTYTCNCTTGYTLNNNFCNDEDECTNGNNTCSADASCTNTDGGYNCTCNSGYTGDGFNCTDEDECTLGTATCSADASCTNTAGGYNCTCNSGYTGDGFNCTNEDECTLNTATCAADATCTDTTGSYNCTCNSGYTGDGFNCTDIDECTAGTDNCNANADCTNTAGSYTCACSAGYSGDGVTNCTDIDECTSGTDNCDVNAACTNTIGSYDCTCNSGYIGDGVSVCIVANPINYCYRAVIEVNTTSGAVTEALTIKAWEDFLAFYISQDVTFYYADVDVTLDTTQGSSPVEIVASACFTNMTKTADELTTTMSTYDFNSHGVLFNSLAAEIADFDECANNFDSNCYDFNSLAGETAFYSAVCANTNGDYSCNCNASLYDVNGNGTLCQDPYTYTCNGTFSTLTLYTDWFNGIGGNNWDVNYMTTNATGCTGELSSDNSTYVFTNCNTTTWQDDDTIHAPVNVYTDTSGLQYITTSLIDFTYECTQEKGQNVTVGFGTNNDTANTVEDNLVDINDIFAPGSTTAVDIAIEQYVSNFETSNLLVSGSTVQTGQMACLQLDVTNAAGVDVQYVTVSTKAPGSSSSLVILENGCTTSEATSFGITVDTSYGNGQMCFTMHRPSGSFALEVDMTVNVCVGTCQAFTCTTRRRRRRAAEGDSRVESGLETVFKIDPADQCSRNCGDGSCMLDFDQTQKCVCNTGAAKVDDGSCKALTVDESGSVDTITTTTSDNSTLYIIVGVAIGVLIFVVILAGFFCYRRRQYGNDKQSHDNFGYKN